MSMTLLLGRRIMLRNLIKTYEEQRDKADTIEDIDVYNGDLIYSTSLCQMTPQFQQKMLEGY